MGARDQAGNGLVEMSTQSTFWFQVRLLEDDVCVPECWEALISSRDDKALGFYLEASRFQPSLGLVLVHVSLFHPLWVFTLECF